MGNAFVVRAAGPDFPEYSAPGVFRWLQRGQARIGWSYLDKLDLRLIHQKIQKRQWNDISAEEWDAWRCHGFFDRVQPNDYLVYPHQPKYGLVTIVRIAKDGAYDYAPSDESIGGDFRSRRACSIVRGTPFDWNDAIVPPVIRRKLGLRGRFFQLYDQDEFEQMLRLLPEKGRATERTMEVSVDAILQSVLPTLPTAIRKEFPSHEFSRFCLELFTAMGYQSQYREGAGERGSDIIVTVATPFFSDEFLVGVQAFAYEGTVTAEATKRKLSQLLSGWEHHSLQYGVLITTGDFDAEARQLVEEHNKKNPEKRVRLIGGRDVSRLFLEYLGRSPA